MMIDIALVPGYGTRQLTPSAWAPTVSWTIGMLWRDTRHFRSRTMSGEAWDVDGRTLPVHQEPAEHQPEADLLAMKTGGNVTCPRPGFASAAAVRYAFSPQ